MITCHVHVHDHYATIDPNLYGHFAEHLGTCIYEGLWVGEESSIPNTHGIRNDVLEALRRIRPPVIRWPGGCFADTYHWEDGIGPRESRPRRVNVWWGQDIETNAFGTHEFMAACRLLGAQPYLCGNVGSGTPQEMAAWVEYCNFEGDSTLAERRRANGAAEPFGVTYWGVGNENWGCGGNLDPEDYAVEYRRFATYLHEFSGRPLYLIGCGPSGNDPDWTRRFLTKLGRRARLHGFAAHYYCGTAGTATEYDERQFLVLVHRALTGMERLIVQQRATLDSFDPERRIGLIVDEWGTWHPTDPGHPPRSLWQQNTIRDALVAAGTLDVFNRHADKLVMGNIAQMINVLQAMCLTDGARMITTPTYHVYELYVPHQGARAVRAVVESEALTFRSDDGKEHRIDTGAGSASLKDRSLYVTLTHHSPSASSEVTIKLHGASAGAARGRVLAGADIRAHNTFEEPEAVRPAPLETKVAGAEVVVTLPPAAVAGIAIDLG